MFKRVRTLLTGIVLGAALIGCGSGGGSDEEDQAETAPPAEEISTEVINNFLWKPVSHSTGRLVVLVNPVGVRAEVTGAVSETLVNTGASNGRGSTLRGGLGGCSYGNEVKVEFFDSLGRRIKLADGRDFATVPFGCSRYEFTL